MCDLMGDIAKEGIEKGRKNAQQGYAFRGIEDVYNTLCGLLAKHRLTLVPHKLLSLERAARETKSGGTLYVTYITVQWKITSAVDGSCEYAESLGEGMDSADKSGNKSMSAAYKYAAVQVFCIPTEGTDDGDATTPEPSRPRAPQSPPPQQQQRASAPQQRAQNYEVVWRLFSTSSVVGQPLKNIPAEKLAGYIARLEKTLKDKDPEIAETASHYYRAALAEHDRRAQLEGSKSGAASA
jgi:hypothetical protein